MIGRYFHLLGPTFSPALAADPAAFWVSSEPSRRLDHLGRLKEKETPPQVTLFWDFSLFPLQWTSKSGPCCNAGIQ